MFSSCLVCVCVCDEILNSKSLACLHNNMHAFCYNSRVTNDASTGKVILRKLFIAKAFFLRVANKLKI